MSAPSWLVERPIAHRGLHDKGSGIVENTVLAADAAIARGFAIECDVQRSADGDAVVFHDLTLDRLTAETGAVADRTSAELSRIGIAGSRSDSIPPLMVFADRIGGQVPLVVEIKSCFDGDMTLTKRTCEILASYDGPVCIKSFDPEVIETVRAIAPDLPRGIVAESTYSHPIYDFMSREQKYALANLLHFERSQPQFISWNVRDLPAAAPYLCRVVGHLPVMTWTVRTQGERERAARHADQIVFEGFIP
jgi:glycerophosphoryl diester phosphodiesterase